MFTEFITFADSIKDMFIVFLTDSISLVDFIRKGFFVSINELLKPRGVSKNKVSPVFAETLSLSENVYPLKGYSLSESYSMIDTVIREIGRAHV